MNPPEDHDTVRRLAHELAASREGDPLLVRLCEAGRRLVGADGTALTVNYLDTSRLTVHASDDVAIALEDLQDVVREGPGFDVARHGGVVAGTLATAGGAWPLLREQAQRLGFGGSVVAAALQAESSVLGVVTMHRAAPHEGFDTEQARILAATLTSAVLQDRDLSRAERSDVEPLGWLNRAAVHQATGMVVAQVRVAPEDALALLRGQAFARGVSMEQVAQDIVERRINFRDFEIEGD